MARLPVENEPDCKGPTNGSGAGCDAASPLHFPDEYLFDGGDHGHPAHYDSQARLGIDPEDTVAEFRDEQGRTHLRTSNRVAVYAPRFGSVSTVSSVNEDLAYAKIAGHDVTWRGLSLGQRTASTTQGQHLATDNVQTRSRASGLEAPHRELEVAQRQRSNVHGQTLNTFESAARLHDSELSQRLTPFTAEQVQAAVIWTRTQYPILAVSLVSANEAKARTVVDVFKGVRSQDKPGQLHINKAADKHTAQPGETVTFKIRFKNGGDRPVSGVVVIDNLTTRLGYVADSATCSLPAKLFVEDNGEGSVQLRWELEQPLPGRTEGEIEFQAQVR